MTIRILPAVDDARARGRPAVALETSVLAQGLPHPRNLETAERMEAAVRENGGEPAWTWVSDGEVRIGATPDDLRRLVEDDAAAKAARRDLPALVGAGALGATTVSAAVWIARRGGIEVAATGGIGGVHPGGTDVSADLLELARTPVTLVCSGPKSILDPVATAERLDELGIAVIGYRCHRLPFFVVREVDVPLEHRVETPREVADTIRARRELGVEAATVVCNPVPDGYALEMGEVVDAVERCRDEAASAAVRGKDVTPFLLGCLARRTSGATLEANVALLESNATLAAQVAAAI
jgi:pseudouridine-5'-phosphate glycosidase